MTKYGVVRTAAELQRRLDGWDGDTIVFDFETDSLNAWEARVIGVSIALSVSPGKVRKSHGHPWLDRTGDIFYIPCNHEVPTNPFTGWTDYSQPWDRAADQMELDAVKAILGPIFARPEVTIVAHNARYDLVVGWVNGLEFKGRLEDTMIMAYVLWPGRTGGHGLKALATKELGKDDVVDYEQATTITWVKKLGKPERGIADKMGAFAAKFERMPVVDTRDDLLFGYTKDGFISGVAHYASADADHTSQLYWKMKSILAWDGVTAGASDERWAARVYEQIERPLVGITARMTLVGVPIDRAWVTAYQGELTQRMQEIERTFTHLYATSLSSNQAVGVLLEKLLQHVGKSLAAYSPRGKSGAYSVAASVLDTIGNAEGVPESVLEVVRLIGEYRGLSKLVSTYTSAWLGGTDSAGRIHPVFDQRGTVTGRFSCVSGDTLLPTSRGTFRFDEYLPQVGDLVQTHTGDWQPVLYKIYKGVSPMVRVCLDSGDVVKCTRAHRVLTPDGWVAVGALSVGDEVYSYVGVKEFYAESNECTGGVGVVCGRSEQTYDSGGSTAFGNNLAKCSCGVAQESYAGALEVRTSLALFTFPSARKPYAGQVWRATSEIQGSYQQRSRLSDATGQRQVHFGASQGFCRGFGFERTVRMLGCSSHQRRQNRQSVRQSGVGDAIGSQYAAPQICRITQIESVGEMGVWDIGVSGDHSYLAHGFINHNSYSPNMQNVPRGKTLGRCMRQGICAPDGYKVVSIDYSQIELRMVAHVSGDPALIRAFLEGQDIHASTAAQIVGKPVEAVTKAERQMAKAVNFAVVYGGGVGSIRYSTGASWDVCQKYFDGFTKRFAGVVKWQQATFAKFQSASDKGNGYVETYYGRRRYMPGRREDGYTMAVNTPIQGTAADLIKIAMGRLAEYIRESDSRAEIVMQVHDEIVFLVPDAEVPGVVPEFARIMETADTFSVPILVEVEIGDNWYDMEAMEVTHAGFFEIV